MGKLNVNMVRYLTSDDYRILTAVEMGMKNHEIVPSNLIAMIAKLRSGGCCKILRNLCKNRLLCHENDKKVEGFRLSFTGYDYLAIKTLLKQGHISYFGNQIGVGKESDVYMVQNDDGCKMALKIHRLGRTSFRKLKEKRDYLKHRHNYSWLYLSRLAAIKEFAFMKALHNRGFPIPEPIAHNRHCVLMQLMVDHVMLSQLAGDLTTEQCDTLYDALMGLLIKLANYGVIHGDFNEFNIMFNPLDLKDIILIDFPQMVPTTHPNADWYFDRDVQGIVTLFKRKFGYDSQIYPKLSDILEKDKQTTLQTLALNDSIASETNQESETLSGRLESLQLTPIHPDTNSNLYTEAMNDCYNNNKGMADNKKGNSLAQTSLLHYFLQSMPDSEDVPSSSDQETGGSEVGSSSNEQAAIIPIFAQPKKCNAGDNHYSDKIQIETTVDLPVPDKKLGKSKGKLRKRYATETRSLHPNESDTSSECEKDEAQCHTNTLASTAFEASVVKQRIEREIKKKRDYQSARRACRAGQAKLSNQNRRLNNLTIREERSAL